MTFQSTILNIYGEKGNTWLEDLPNQVNRIAKQYQLSHLKPVNNLSYNYVLSGFRQNVPVILKMGLDQSGLAREVNALNAFANHGAVKVLSSEPGMLLLQQAVPGDSLKSYYPKQDLDSVRIACEVMTRLHQAPIPVDYTFPHIQTWLEALDKDWDIPNHYLIQARKTKEKLLNQKIPSVLLHGDLHHDNILSDTEKSWLVIDPKGVIGPAVCEIWAFMHNPEKTSQEMLLNRINLFSDVLKINKQDILSWCYVQSVLSWAWDLEDNLKPSAVWITKILHELLNERSIL